MFAFGREINIVDDVWVHFNKTTLLEEALIKSRFEWDSNKPAGIGPVTRSC